VTRAELMAAQKSGQIAPMKQKQPAFDDDDGPDDE
jgi:hypothetical protein